MLFGEIDFPRPLIEAQEGGELVVFAGAGVSIPPPSNLPDFTKLAVELASETEIRGKDEPIDRFLGRLKEDLNIHERARKRLSDPESKPNPLHRNLLRLFDGADRTRLATTNFDDHFASSARELYETQRPEMFFAPALPVGSDFTGIVHLHGSVTKDPKRMVLTDRDFGRAYLTEGWARRFLQELFSKYVVLFVGYSHNDPVVHYLARGLPPSASIDRRFALAEGGEDERWENLGIQPLPYPRRDDDSRHIALGSAISKWANLVRCTPLEHQERIKSVVEKPPPPAGEDLDYIEKALDDISLTRFFVHYADAVEWLHWMEKKSAFRKLFRSGQYSITADRDSQLAWWFAEKFACDHSGRALDLIRRNGSALGPICWHAVTLAIYRRISDSRPLQSLDKWVPLLISNSPKKDESLERLEHILMSCRPRDDSVSALLLFRHLLRPVIRLKPNIRFNASPGANEPDIEVELETVGDDFWIGQVWRQLFQTNLGAFANQLAAFVTAHLEEASLLYRSFGMEHTSGDPISWLLPTVDAHSISLQNSGVGVLIDVALRTLAFFLENSPERANALIETWASANSIALRRFAAFGVAKSESWTPDEKLRWLLGRELVYRPGFRQEVLMVLRAAFREASEAMKSAVVDRVIEGPDPDAKQEYRDIAINQFLLTLSEVDPEYSLAAKELESLRLRRPSLSSQREPEPSGQGEFPWDRPPFSVAELLSAPARTKIADLLSFEPTRPGGLGRRSLVGAVEQAVQEQPQWGFDLAAALREEAAWGTDLWMGVIRGWNRPNLSPGQLTEVLTLLTECPGIVRVAADEVASLLERGFSDEARLNEARQFELALRISAQVWSELEQRPEDRREDANEWLTVAINNPAGILMQFEVRALTNVREQAGESWTGLPKDVPALLTGVVGGESWAAEMGRIVLASQVYTLFTLDANWTLENLLPLFDWDLNARTAKQAWHGHLVWGRWDDDFLKHFFPSYVKTFPRVHGHLGKPREQFCQHMAGVALFSAIHPLKDGWLRGFIKEVGPEERIMWASGVRLMLERVTAENKRLVWETWINLYWQERLDGRLPKLEGREVAAMIGWSLNLLPVFPEALELILKSPPADYWQPELYMRMQRSNVCEDYPRESAVLLRHMLRSDTTLMYSDPIVEMTRDLLGRGADPTVLIDICQELARLGYLEAVELRALIETRGSSKNLHDGESSTPLP